MAFFNTSDADNAPASTQAGTATPLFRQGDPPPGTTSAHVSLSDYISRHLSERTSEEPQAEQKVQTQAAPEQAPHLNTPFRNPQLRPGAASHGRLLNRLDVDLQAGLEQYLPTPVFRLRVMKKRLDGEIADLKLKLSKYERLSDTSIELQERVAVLQQRIDMLETHEQMVREELSGILKFGPGLYAFSKRFRGAQSGFGQLFEGLRERLRHLVYGPEFLKLEALGDKMRVLEEIMEERLSDPAATDAEISRVLHRYEQALRQSEAAALQVKPLGLPARLWQQASRLIE